MVLRVSMVHVGVGEDPGCDVSSDGEDIHVEVRRSLRLVKSHTRHTVHFQ